MNLEEVKEAFQKMETVTVQGALVNLAGVDCLYQPIPVCALPLVDMIRDGSLGAKLALADAMVAESEWHESYDHDKANEAWHKELNRRIGATQRAMGAVQDLLAPASKEGSA